MNKEKREFIKIQKDWNPILFKDTRKGDIYTLKLDKARKSLDTVPPFVKSQLKGKFQLNQMLFDETNENFFVNFKHVEKFTDDDLDSINEYLMLCGYIPADKHIVNLLKASVSFKPLKERTNLFSKFETELERNNIVFSNNSELNYYMPKDEYKELFEHIAVNVFGDQININQVPVFTINHYLNADDVNALKPIFKESSLANINKQTIVLNCFNSDQYNIQTEFVQKTFKQHNFNIEIPDYQVCFNLSINNNSDNRKKYLSSALQRLEKTREMASNIEYDDDASRVIRFEFSFTTSEEREQILDTLEREFNSLDSMFKLTLKDKHGHTKLHYVLDSKVINQLDENLKLNYQGEDIKLVDGRIYNSLFSDIQDPENIIDPDLRNKYNRFMEECPVIGQCHKMTTDFIVVQLSESFFNGERMKQNIKEEDMVFFPSIGSSTDLRRQSEAILRINKPAQKLQNGRPILPPVNPKLSDFLFSPLYARGIKADINMMIQSIKDNKLEGLLNDKQIEAVAKSVLAEDIAFIQGPPGTGKTTVIAEIIWQEIRRNPKCKILLTSQTNLAVDNALERLKHKGSIRPLRVISDQRIDRDDLLYNINVLDHWVDSPNEYTTGNVVDTWIDQIVERISKDEDYSGEVEEWRTMLTTKDKSTRRFFVEKYKTNVNLIAATCSLCGSLLFKHMYSKMYNTEDVAFDVVIMDEASKATPLEMAIPMVLGKKIIVIGDHKQLPPLMDENSIDTALKKLGREDLANRIEDLKESQFKKLFLMSQKYNPTLVTTLDTQYRMHKDIMMTINQFYEDELGSDGLKCGIEKEMDINNPKLRGSRYHGISCEPFLSPSTHAIWVNVDGKESKENTSYKNLCEIKAIKTIMALLSKANGFKEYIKGKQKIEDKEIGLITFYSAQKRELRKLVDNDEIDAKLDYRIDVVDRFQGMERNIVIVSTVRSNKYNGVGFAKDIERINVAFSRARTLLIVVGNRDLFNVHNNYQKSIGAMEYINIKQLEDLLKYEQ